MSAQITETRTARFLVTFSRIGRTHDVPPLNTEADNAEDLAAKIYSYARPYLASRYVDVYLDLEKGSGGIECGFHSGGMFTIVDREAWHQRCDQPKNTFQPGTRVRHRNPKYADWCGIVEPETSGRYRGRCVRLSVPFDGAPWVHIRWTGGSYAEHGPAAGWYDVTAIAADGVR